MCWCRCKHSGAITMLRRLAAAALLLCSGLSTSLAQQPASPVPLYPGAAPRQIEPEPLPPLPPAAAAVPSPIPPPPPAAMAPPAGPPLPATPNAAPATARVFCAQPVSVRVAEPDAVAPPYRPFLGIWSDAAWSPQLCAALIVENVAPDGTATLTYAFGPMGSNPRSPGGVLHGTGSIRDGELRFQNSDGSQFAFRPVYADLDGKLTTPQGQTYEAVFKQTP
jgi:hypothetical protein